MPNKLVPSPLPRTSLDDSPGRIEQTDILCSQIVALVFVSAENVVAVSTVKSTNDLRTDFYDKNTFIFTAQSPETALSGILCEKGKSLISCKKISKLFHY